MNINIFDSFLTAVITGVLSQFDMLQYSMTATVYFVLRSLFVCMALGAHNTDTGGVVNIVQL